MVNTGRAFAGNFLLHKHCTIQYQAGTVSATQIEGRAITLYIQAGHIYNHTLCFSGLFTSLVPGEMINEQEERAWALPLGIQDRG